MTCVRVGVAAIALGATGAVASAQAQTQAAAPERTMWDVIPENLIWVDSSHEADHNGS